MALVCLVRWPVSFTAWLGTFQELSSHSPKSKTFLPLIRKEEELQVIIAYDGVAVLLRI